MTSFSDAREDIRFKRTSDAASLSKRSTGGTKCEIVASLPKMGANSVATMASAARTCSLSSSVSVVIRFTKRSATAMRGRHGPLSNESLLSVDLISPPANGGGTVALHFATAAKLKVAAVRT